jgi:hypothetical protein
MTNAEFLAHLNKVIGQTMRRLQLTSGPMREHLRAVVRWLNRARASIKKGFRRTAESDFRLAFDLLKAGRSQCAH